MTIIRTTYRYKRPPRKRKLNPAALAMPAIVQAKKPDRRRTSRGQGSGPNRPRWRVMSAKSAIVTVRNRKHGALAQTRLT